MIDAQTSSPAPYFGNVIAPTPGRCFRMVRDAGREGYPMRCPERVRWHGLILDPQGRRVEVEACGPHASELAERHEVTQAYLPPPC